MFEPVAIGNCTLNAEVSAERMMRKTSWVTGEKLARGNSAPNVTAPAAITLRMYQRARGGRSRSKWLQYTGAGAPVPALTGLKQLFYTIV